MSTTTTSRLNMRIDPDALATLREAAREQQQDLTSFVLGAAMERARSVVLESRVSRLSQSELSALESALDREPRVVPELAALMREVQDMRIRPASAKATVTT